MGVEDTKGDIPYWGSWTFLEIEGSMMIHGQIIIQTFSFFDGETNAGASVAIAILNSEAIQTLWNDFCASQVPLMQM